jgi:hypothetical protein
MIVPVIGSVFSPARAIFLSEYFDEKAGDNPSEDTILE